MLKKWMGLLALLMLGTGMWAQSERATLTGDLPAGEHCATMTVDAAMRAQYPELGTYMQFEQWLQERMAHQDEWEAQRGDPIFTIPVVVHVVHNGTAIGVADNISAAQVQSQIDVLNEDFQRMAGTPGFNTDSVGADTEIEFCLAYIAPDGTKIPEAGINRINRNFEGFTAPPYTETYIENTIKPATIWDPSKYFNIWVLSLSPTETLGYARFPSQSGLPGIFQSSTPQNDGVVIQPQFFGRTGNVTFPFDKGRTTTHEIGHSLGLLHISGDDTCGTDDFCADTPESDEQNYGCPTNHVSCGSTDMVQNYMDYSDDACFNIFTQCQKTRMRTVLANSPRRAELANSTVCEVPTAIPVAAFTIDSSQACNGIYQFMDASSPLATNWFWSFSDGRTFSVKNPELTFDSVGIYTLTLITNNDFGSSTPVNATFSVGLSGQLDVNAGPDVTIQPGGFTLLTATGASSYIWSPSTGLNNPNISNPIAQPAVTTIYSVTGTNPDGCTGENGVVVFVNGTVGIDELVEETGTIFPAFPNPAHDAITFAADFRQPGNLRLTLQDLAGRTVRHLFRDRTGAGAFEYIWTRDSALPGGIYFAVWEYEGNRHVQKVQLY